MWASRDENDSLVVVWNLQPYRLIRDGGDIFVGDTVGHCSTVMPLEHFEARYGFSLNPGECKPISIDSVEPWGWDFASERERGGA